MANLIGPVSLKGKVAIITGASRGIGRSCALALAERGCNIVIAAKSDTPQPTLPGTIYTVAKEVEATGSGAKALACKVDVRNEDSVENCIKQTMDVFGRIDILINNASALWWQDITDTPTNRYNLINEVNSRGTFFMTRACLPHMRKNENGVGHVINMSPPISTEGINGKTAYSISKFGMTLVALGVAQEEQNICGCSLWPKTVVESSASENFKMGSKSFWRKATVLSDSVLAIVTRDPQVCSNQMFIDETLLRQVAGLQDQDFVQYRYDPDVEPPSMADLAKAQDGVFKRGRALVRAPSNSKL